ncbi:MAG: hypothetical protein M1820_009546 [Bogoriella megaspora]|nr:MAG: hypothetical protein M1820_009546 [Bogoriella megaspora]
MDRLRIFRVAQSPIMSLPIRPKPSMTVTSTPTPQSSLSQSSPFSSTTILQKRKRKAPKEDSRILNIKYFLAHPVSPRPLRFSRHRALRHWTIHRAWQLYQSKLRTAQYVELERQYHAMRDACEALRTLGEDGMAYTIAAPSNAGSAGTEKGMTGTERVRGVEVVNGKEVEGKTLEPVVLAGSPEAHGGSDIGYLYRRAMEKKGVWQGVPIEYARAQTETPSRDGWDHAWKR